MGRIYDIVVRVIRRRGKPSTPLPPKSQLPIAEYVYCYDPVDDDGTAGAGWHWEPRKPYFDRSAEAILEYDAPMSSSASLVKPLPSSRFATPSSTATELTSPRQSRASGTMLASTGALALYSGEFDTAQDISVDERGMLSQLASASPSSPDNAPEKGIEATLPSAALNAPNFTSSFTNDTDTTPGVMSAAASDYFAGHDSPPRAGPSRHPARPQTTQPKSILKKPKSPATTVHSIASADPFIPPIIPSPPPAIPIIPSPPSPAASPFIPFIPPLPSPPPARGRSPRRRHHAPSETRFQRAHAPHRQRATPVVPPRPRSWSPPARPIDTPAPPLPRHKRVRDFPAGYYGGVSHLLSPGELVFSFLHPSALHRRLLDGANRLPVAPNDAELRTSAFFPHVAHALFLVPQLPWAIVLRADPMISVGHVLSGLREHLGQRLTRAEREMVREHRDSRNVRLRGDVVGVERSWLLGIWEDVDTVRRLLRARTGKEEHEVVQGRRCFIVVFGSEEEARALSGD